MRRLQRPRPPRRDARRSPTGSAAERSPPVITPGLPSPTTPPARCCGSPPIPPRTRPTCSLRSSRRRSRACGSRSGTLTKPEVRRIAASAGLPVASKADSQDLCFLAGTDRARFLARHGGLGDAAGADRRRRRHRRSAGTRPAPVHGRPAARARNRGRRAAVRARQGRGPQPGDRRSALGARGPRAFTSAAPGFTAPARASTGSSSATGRDRRVPRRRRSAASPGRHAAELKLGEPVDGAAPGQLACLMDGELVVGWGTIARADESPRPSALPRLEVRVADEHQRVGGPEDAGRGCARTHGPPDSPGLVVQANMSTFGKPVSARRQRSEPASGRVAEDLVALVHDVRRASGPWPFSPVLTTKCLPPVILEIFSP